MSTYFARVRSAEIEPLWSDFALEADAAKRNALAAQIQPTALRPDLTGRFDGMTLSGTCGATHRPSP